MGKKKLKQIAYNSLIAAIQFIEPTNKLLNYTDMSYEENKISDLIDAGLHKLSEGDNKPLQNNKNNTIMKTAMEELIEKIQTLKILDGIINPLDIFQNLCERQLEKEKQQIVDAWDLSTAATASDDTGIEYYNQTYKQND